MNAIVLLMCGFTPTNNDELAQSYEKKMSQLLDERKALKFGMLRLRHIYITSSFKTCSEKRIWYQNSALRVDNIIRDCENSNAEGDRIIDGIGIEFPNYLFKWSDRTNQGSVLGVRFDKSDTVSTRPSLLQHTQYAGLCLRIFGTESPVLAHERLLCKNRLNMNVKIDTWEGEPSEVYTFDYTLVDNRVAHHRVIYLPERRQVAQMRSETVSDGVKHTQTCNNYFEGVGRRLPSRIEFVRTADGQVTSTCKVTILEENFETPPDRSVFTLKGVDVRPGTPILGYQVKGKDVYWDGASIVPMPRPTAIAQEVITSDAPAPSQTGRWISIILAVLCVLFSLGYVVIRRRRTS